MPNTGRIKRLRRDAFRDQHGKCYWCDGPMSFDVPENDPTRCTADHLVPASQKGSTSRKNIVAACRRCNNNRKTGWGEKYKGKPLVWPTMRDLIERESSHPHLRPPDRPGDDGDARAARDVLVGD